MQKTERAFSGQEPVPPGPGDGFERNRDKYVVCGTGKCSVAHDDSEIWCINEKDCPRPNHPDDPCQCVLIRAKKSLSRRRGDRPKWEGDPDEPKWDADGQCWKYPYNPEQYWYAGVCARKL
jgi:hypothetical protein